MIIINYVRDKLFVTFDNLVQEGKIVVLDSNNSLLSERKFLNSNFEKVILPEYTGEINVRINYDNSEYFKKIHINNN